MAELGRNFSRKEVDTKAKLEDRQEFTRAKLATFLLYDHFPNGTVGYGLGLLFWLPIEPIRLTSFTHNRLGHEPSGPPFRCRRCAVPIASTNVANASP